MKRADVGVWAGDFKLEQNDETGNAVLTFDQLGQAPVQVELGDDELDELEAAIKAYLELARLRG